MRSVLKGVGAVLVVGVLYVASIGPTTWLLASDGNETADDIVLHSQIYGPLYWAGEKFPPLAKVTYWWHSLWMPPPPYPF